MGNLAIYSNLGFQSMTTPTSLYVLEQRVTWGPISNEANMKFTQMQQTIWLRLSYVSWNILTHTNSFDATLSIQWFRGSQAM